MATLTKIDLVFDTGVTQSIKIGPTQTTIETPFGIVDLTNSKPVAPVPSDVADNPGKYEGTVYDPLNYRPPIMWNGIPTASITWADWFMGDKDSALDYIQTRGMLGKPINLNNLSPTQKRKLGL